VNGWFDHACWHWTTLVGKSLWRIIVTGLTIGAMVFAIRYALDGQYAHACWLWLLSRETGK
jgi:hypothetical protein